MRAASISSSRWGWEQSRPLAGEGWGTGCSPELIGSQFSLHSEFSEFSRPWGQAFIRLRDCQINLLYSRQVLPGEWVLPRLCLSNRLMTDSWLKLPFSFPFSVNQSFPPHWHQYFLLRQILLRKLLETICNLSHRESSELRSPSTLCCIDPRAFLETLLFDHMCSNYIFGIFFHPFSPQPHSPFLFFSLIFSSSCRQAGILIFLCLTS